MGERRKEIGGQSVTFRRQGTNDATITVNKEKSTQEIMTEDGGSTQLVRYLFSFDAADLLDPDDSTTLLPLRIGDRFIDGTDEYEVMPDDDIPKGFTTGTKKRVLARTKLVRDANSC